MRISTAMSYERGVNGILNAQVKLDKTQQQLATGRQILNPADNPSDSTRVLELRQAIANTDQYQKNADSATSRLNLEESALMSASDILKRVRTLAIQANHAGLADSDRRSLALEMRQGFDALLGLANTRDANGEYLFAGHDTLTEPFTANNYKVAYMGDQGQRFIQVGPDDLVATNDSGWNVFFDIPTVNGNGVFVTAPAPQNSHGASIDPGIVTNLSDWQQDNYTLSFTGENTYEVRDSAGGIITQGAYRSGDEINFRGIQTAITGTPIVGDNFTIAATGPNPKNQGAAILHQSTVVDSTAWKQDIYTLSFSSTRSYQVTDSAGAIIDIGNYQNGRPITFRGVQTKITGTPAVGDKFVLSPGTKQDVFSTINTLATVLENATGLQSNTNISTAVAQAIQDIDHADNRVLDTRAAIGSRLNRISNAKDGNNYFSIQLNSSVSTLEDLDYTSAVSKLNLQTLGLQTAQQAYVKVVGMSLFQYLR